MNHEPINDEVARLAIAFESQPSAAPIVGWQLADLVRRIMSLSLSSDNYSAEAFLALKGLADELRNLPPDVNLRDCIIEATSHFSAWSFEECEKDQLVSAAVDGGRYLLELSRNDSYVAGRRSRARERFQSAIKLVD